MYLILKIISCWNVTATFKNNYLRGVVCRVRLQSVCPITVPGLPRLDVLQGLGGHSETVDSQWETFLVFVSPGPLTEGVRSGQEWQNLMRSVTGQFVLNNSCSSRLVQTTITWSICCSWMLKSVCDSHGARGCSDCPDWLCNNGQPVRMRLSWQQTFPVLQL